MSPLRVTRIKFSNSNSKSVLLLTFEVVDSFRGCLRCRLVLIWIPAMLELPVPICDWTNLRGIGFLTGTGTIMDLTRKRYHGPTTAPPSLINLNFAKYFPPFQCHLSNLRIITIMNVNLHLDRIQYILWIIFKFGLLLLWCEVKVQELQMVAWFIT